MQNQTAVISEIQNESKDSTIPPIFSECYVKSGFGKEDDYLIEAGSDTYLCGYE